MLWIACDASITCCARTRAASFGDTDGPTGAPACCVEPDTALTASRRQVLRSSCRLSDWQACTSCVAVLPANAGDDSAIAHAMAIFFIIVWPRGYPRLAYCKPACGHRPWRGLLRIPAPAQRGFLLATF